MYNKRIKWKERMKETVKLRQWTPLGQSWVWVLAAFVKCVVVVVVVTTQPFQSIYLAILLTEIKVERERERETKKLCVILIIILTTMQ